MLKTDPIMTRMNRSTDPNVLYNEVLEIFKYEPVKHHSITVAERIKQKYMDRLGGKFRKKGKNVGRQQDQVDAANAVDAVDAVDSKEVEQDQIDIPESQNSEPLPYIDNPETEMESNGKKLKKKKKRKSKQQENTKDQNDQNETDTQQEQAKDQNEPELQRESVEQIDKRNDFITELQPVKVVSLSKIKQKIPMIFECLDAKQNIFEWKDATQNEPGWTPITKDHLGGLPTIACPDEKTWNYFQQSTFIFEPYILVPIQKTLTESKQFFVAKMKNG